LRKLKEIAVGWWAEFSQKFNGLREHALGIAWCIRVDERREAALSARQQAISIAGWRLWL